MSFSRRSFLFSTAGLAAAPFVSKIAKAETYPVRPIRFVVPFPAGGVSDIIARQVGQWLLERLGQPLVVEDRGGAGSNLGTEVVVNSPPDGYTLLLDGSANAVNATLYPDLSFVYLHDITPVASMFRAPHIMEVNPSFPAQTIPDFIAYAKAHPRQINMASAGIGTISHMAGELFAMMTGIELTHVPYRGAAPAVNDLIGHQVQMMIADVTALLPQIQAGRVRLLAVTGVARVASLPDTPTLVELGYAVEAENWYGLYAPARTPPAVIARLHDLAVAAATSPEVRRKLAEQGAIVVAGTPEEFAAFVRSEIVKWGTVVQAAGIARVN
jgi:tripartite-type tricarboxylate transporter receptor subunit TctC